MGCGATKHAAELPTPAPGSVDLGGNTTTLHAQEPVPAGPDKNPVTDAAAEAQAADIVKGTSAEVKAAAEADAARAGEDWAQLSWQRRQKLCASAAATVLQAKIDAGPRGATVQFRGDDFADPAGLVAWITQQKGKAKLRPDHKLIYTSDWPDKETRTKGVRYLVSQLAVIAGKAAA